MAELPSGTVTFLFTDLEGSTRLWEDHPAAMKGALARHDALMRTAIAEHGGYVVKTTGDGFHAAFATAADALEAASVAQLRMVDESWGATGPPKVRMGLHTCEAELRDGDYYGSAVNRAARLMSIAHGGQIVLSAATGELARERDLNVVDLGEHRLRDLSRAERVLQLCPPGLKQEFPPLTSLDELPGNLPLQVTAFVGRETELADLAKLLGSSRLVTLSGPGGVGKTRLALQIAALAAPDFPDGAWFVDLAPIDDPDFVANEVANTMGLAERRQGTTDEWLARALARRRALVLLDNCEHVVDVAAEIADVLLRHCPGIRVIATSQEMLGIDGEASFAVRPLSSPSPVDPTNLDELLANDAIRLFVERATSARHGFELTAENGGAVAELCGRLDGIPLAIELAAARVASMSPAAILERIDERFRLLAQGRRTARKRHQTLRAAVDWSYGLLEPMEQEVFTRLAVFAGDFALEAAEAVVADDLVDRLDVVDLLGGLVAKSMVSTDDTSGTDRYRLLETMRDYGRERLSDQSELETWYRRHAAYYRSLAETAAPHLVGRDDRVWFARLRSEVANLRAALGFLRDEGEGSEFCSFVFALARIWYLEGQLREGQSWIVAALNADPDHPTRERAQLAAFAAGGAINLSQWEEGREFVRLSMEVSAALNEPPRPLALLALGLEALVQNRPEESRRLGDEAIKLARVNVVPFELAEALERAAMFFSLTDDGPRGCELADEALEISRTLGNHWLEAAALEAAGIARYRSDPARAVAILEEALGSGAREGTMGSQTRMMKAVAHLALHDERSAARSLREALPIMQEEGEEYYQTITLGVAAMLLRRMDRRDPAVRILALIDRLREAGRIVGAPRDLDSQAQLRERLERELGSEAFAFLWAEGRAMSLDDAVTLALDELDCLIADATDE